MERDGEFSQQSGKCLPTASLLKYAGYADLPNPAADRCSTSAFAMRLLIPSGVQYDATPVDRLTLQLFKWFRKFVLSSGRINLVNVSV